jgi:hypothetical protein
MSTAIMAKGFGLLITPVLGWLIYKFFSGMSGYGGFPYGKNPYDKDNLPSDKEQK